MIPSQWQTFIQEQGASFNDNNEASFENKESQHSDDFLCDLSYLGVLEISGEDCLTFLQGQLTNDINLATNELSQLSAYCTPKGRMLALFRIIPRGDKLWLVFPIELLEAIQKRLQMFVMMSKVEIKNLSDEVCRMGIVGQNAITTLKDKGYALSNDAQHITSQDNSCLVKVSEYSDRYFAIGPSNELQSLWQELNEQGVKAENTAQWKLCDILDGVPQVYQKTQEAFVPQMQNLHLLDGINFKKGCYTGQEVVARMHYLGKLKRQMFLLASDQASEPGASLYSPSSSSGQGAGKVVDAQYNAKTSQYNLLAVLEIASAENNQLFLDEEHQISASISPLPYAIETDSE